MKESIFRKIQKEFQVFLKTNQVAQKKPQKAKVKPIKKVFIKQKGSSFEPNEGIDALRNTHNHRVGRMNDWYELYGQGMYE